MCFTDITKSEHECLWTISCKSDACKLSYDKNELKIKHSVFQKRQNSNNNIIFKELIWYIISGSSMPHFDI
jgi:hypothetical protein